MSEDSQPNVVYASMQGRLETGTLQQVVGQQEDPGVIYLPPGRWEENLLVTQHNLTIVGSGKDTIIEGAQGQPVITVTAPNVRLINFAVRTEYSQSAIAFTKANATQCVLANMTVLESGGHGIYRDADFTSALIAILDCDFHNIGEHGIRVESGAGPQNLVWGNRGEDIEGDFINWGVDSSMLIDNQSDGSLIRLTEESKSNFTIGNDALVIDESEKNFEI